MKRTTILSFAVFVHRLLELEHAHTTETSRLQHSHASQLAGIQHELKEEREKKEVAERLLEAQRDVAISMEDVQPFAGSAGLDSSGSSEPKTFCERSDLYVLKLMHIHVHPCIHLQ